MVTIKKLIMPLALCAEIGLFAFFYFTSPLGFKALTSLKKDNRELQNSLTLIESNIAQLKNKINEWKKYPWYTEQVARQELQMSYPGEEIFLLESNTPAPATGPLSDQTAQSSP